MTNQGVVSAIMQKAESKLKTADIDFEHGQYDDAVSRAYYAVFHAISAVLSWKKMVFSSRSQTVGAFNREFIKTGVFPKEYSAYINSLFTDRQTGDYDIDKKLDSETAENSLENASQIVVALKKYLKNEGAL